MDTKFQRAIAAIKSGDLERLESLIHQDPSLATSRSSTSHPTLLQCLALDAVEAPNQVEMAKVLIDAGANISEPLVAAASIDNIPIAATLLDAGAPINGNGWSPLEEALYWGNKGVINLLLERGASIHNLRIASGLGRLDLMASFFNSDGTSNRRTQRFRASPQKSCARCVTALPPDVRRWLCHVETGQIIPGYALGSGLALPILLGQRPHEGHSPKVER